MSGPSLGELNEYNRGTIWDLVFQYLPFKDTVQNTRVCKVWNERATIIAKKILIENFENSTLAKGNAFFKMAARELKVLCPAYQQIKETQENKSIKRIWEGLEGIIEKHTVCFAGCFVVDPTCPNIPADRINDIAGKAFGEFHYTVEGESSPIRFWKEMPGRVQPSEKLYFPIELFNLAVQIETRTVTGDKDSGVFCFFLKGRLIEIALTPGAVTETRLGLAKINRNVAPIQSLTPEDADSGYVWPSDLYIPRLDSMSFSCLPTKSK